MSTQTQPDVRTVKDATTLDKYVKDAVAAVTKK